MDLPGNCFGKRLLSTVSAAESIVNSRFLHADTSDTSSYDTCTSTLQEVSFSWLFETSKWQLDAYGDRCFSGTDMRGQKEQKGLGCSVTLPPTNIEANHSFVEENSLPAHAPLP